MFILLILIRTWSHYFQLLWCCQYFVGFYFSLSELFFTVLQMISRVIFEAFANPDPMKKDNAAGIQLVGIIAANGLSPIASDSTIDEDR